MPPGLFERYLTVWVFLCISVGTLVGLTALAVALLLGVGSIPWDTKRRSCCGWYGS